MMLFEFFRCCENVKTAFISFRFLPEHENKSTNKFFSIKTEIMSQLIEVIFCSKKLLLLSFCRQAQPVGLPR